MIFFENLRCKFSHDWEIKNRINEGKLITNLERKYFDNPFPRVDITTHVLNHKKCRRCDTEIDEISDFSSNYVQARLKKQKERKLQYG